jgi:predicted transport protein
MGRLFFTNNKQIKRRWAYASRFTIKNNPIILYKISNASLFLSMILGIHFTKSRLHIDFHAKVSELPDPKGIAKPVSNGDWSVVSLTHPKDIPYVLSLVKLAYERS